MRTFRMVVTCCVALALLVACVQAPERSKIASNSALRVHGVDWRELAAEPEQKRLAESFGNIPIPRPALIAFGDQNCVLTSGAQLVLMSRDPKAIAAARYFADTLRRTSSFDLHVVLADALPTSNAIVFALDPKTEVSEPEGYVVDSGPGLIEVRARTPAGLFYGGITLWQLLTPNGATPVGYAKSVQIPALHIEDRPRFAWRGLMLDSARHVQPVSFIETLLDQMALHKLNMFQWHLSDDQGWRLAIARYPELTKIGAWRKPVGPDIALANADGKYGGWYTPEQIREVVRYAAARYITVVPEIEMPGHAQAAIASYPQFGVTGTRPPVSNDWGVNTWLYDIDDGTFAFLQDVLDETMALFPSPYLHIGGDEAVKDQWQASKKIQREMHALGIADEDALQSWFIARIGKYLSAHGRKLVGWDEILQGGVPADAIVMSWQGEQGAVKAASLGHDTVMSPSPAMYFDHLQSDLPDEPTGRPDVVSLKDVYDFDAIPKQLDAQQAAHVLGAQANLWSEYLTTPARVAHAAFPRSDALAEALWSPAGARDWPSFLARMPAQLARYRMLGIDFADDAFAVKIDATADGAGKAKVALSNQARFGTIRYTLDGSTPDASSTAYAASFAVPMPAIVRANVFVDGEALAAPRQRALDAVSLLRLDSDRLRMCSNALPLRLENGGAEAGIRYNIDILDPCWIYPKLDLATVDRIDVRVGTVPNNFALWHDASKIVMRTPRTPAGELEIHADTCDGPLLASLPMAGVAPGTPATLRATLKPRSGTHDICLFFTGRSPTFLRATEWVSPVLR
ncbi:MAG TPA: family 20 glycosylhydrolase [Rhodanobacteraceae bacterium]|nr:family 20 glycosylhydrolase [Rhodanobacteraceae bacterium]